MLKFIKETIEFISAVLYAPVMFMTSAKPLRLVIYYHRIKKQDVEGFRRQMDYLAQNCLVVKPSEIKTVQTDRSETLVSVTFDDAFENIIDYAVPILKEYGLTAGIFVPCGNLGRKLDWEVSDNCPDKDEIIMSKEQISQLYRDGFEMLSHTMSHPVLTEMNDDRLESEMAESKQMLEAIVGHEVTVISYPYGFYNDRVCDSAKEYGYKLGFTVDPEIVMNSTDDLRVGRFLVSPSSGLLTFKLKLCGAYRVVFFLRKIKSYLKDVLKN